MTDPASFAGIDAERALIQAEMRRTGFGPLDADCHECLDIAYQRVIAVALVGILTTLERGPLCHQTRPPSAG